MCFFFFNDTATTEIYTLSLHDALPISHRLVRKHRQGVATWARVLYLGRLCQLRELPPVLKAMGLYFSQRSEEHTSELQSPCNLVCRLLLEKKKKQSLCT